MSWIATKPVPDPAPPITSIGYIGSVPRGEVRAPDYRAVVPQAFSVHMTGTCDPLRTHFHAVDQFQFFTRGSARVANHEMVSGAVHYADRNTPYGPITPGADGADFLTLRSASSAGAFYMPDGRTRLGDTLAHDPGDRPVSGRRNIVIDLGTSGDGAPGVWQDRCADPDGLRIATADVAPSAEVAVEPVAGDGAYLVVISGHVRGDDGLAPAGSILWCEAGDGGSVAAGPDGARLALLQLPVRPSV